MCQSKVLFEITSDSVAVGLKSEYRVKGFPVGRRTNNILLFPISLQNDWDLKVKPFRSMGIVETQEKQCERRRESESDLYTPSVE
jgi:hypothetical protein